MTTHPPMPPLEIAIGNIHLDLGASRRGVDMGPSAIHLAGLTQGIQPLGHRVAEVFAIQAPSAEMLVPGDPGLRYLPEIAGVCRQLADRVEAHLGRGRFPLILGGDHSVAIGTVSGIARHHRGRGRPVGLIWIDAHADANTPETSPSGNIHGMPLAVLLGHGHPHLTGIAGDAPAVRPEHVCIIGARDLDEGEKHLLRTLGVRVMTMSEVDERGIAACMDEAIQRAGTGTAGIHLSFDLDGVDPIHAPGVGTAVPGGLSLRESHLVCEKLATSGRLVGIEMVEFNPVLDHMNGTGRLAVWLILSALGKTIL